MFTSDNLLKDIEAKGKLVKLASFPQILVLVFAIFIALYHIFVLSIYPVSPWIFYLFHVVTAIILILVLHPMTKSRNKVLTILDMLFIVLIIGSAAYLILNMDAIISRIATTPTGLDIFASGILILLVLETTRRTSGIILPGLAILFILYAHFGYIFPGIIGHRGYSWERITSYLTGFDGLFSSPVSATANFVFMFIIFGAFLSASGSGKFFIDFALGATGRKRGGPAKAGVFASALMGTVSGTSVSNVVATGAFTIPLMKRIGYSPRFAGAVESVASTGGQIMPPILGSAAFIMAAMTGIPYLDIVIASILPAFLYFFAVYIMVDLEAAKTGMKGLPKDEVPNTLAVFKKSGYLLAPLIVLIFVLTVLKASPNKAALWAIIAAFVVSFFKKHTRMNPMRLLSAFANSAISAMGIISASAGIIIGVLNLTGVGLRFASYVIDLSGNNLFMALFLTMVACLILGMGLPTAASYIIAATVMAPVLVELGVNLMAAHMFVFYYACLSAITPPVALAAFAGAGIAEAKPMDVAVTSVKLGIIAFIVPFMFAYDQVLLLDGSIGRIIIVTITATIGTYALASSVQCWFLNRKISRVEGMILAIASILLIVPERISDIAGIVVIVAMAIYVRMKKESSPVARYIEK